MLYASQYSGFFKLDTAKIKRSARALVGKVDLLGALEKLGFPDDPAGIKAQPSTWPRTEWEANEHRALGGAAGFAASFMVRETAVPRDQRGRRQHAVRHLFRRSIGVISCCLK